MPAPLGLSEIAHAKPGLYGNAWVRVGQSGYTYLVNVEDDLLAEVLLQEGEGELLSQDQVSN